MSPATIHCASSSSKFSKSVHQSSDRAICVRVCCATHTHLWLRSSIRCPSRTLGSPFLRASFVVVVVRVWTQRMVVAEFMSSDFRHICDHMTTARTRAEVIRVVLSLPVGCSTKNNSDDLRYIPNFQVRCATICIRSWGLCCRLESIRETLIRLEDVSLPRARWMRILSSCRFSYKVRCVCSVDHLRSDRARSIQTQRDDLRRHAVCCFGCCHKATPPRIFS